MLMIIACYPRDYKLKSHFWIHILQLLFFHHYHNYYSTMVTRVVDSHEITVIVIKKLIVDNFIRSMKEEITVIVIKKLIVNNFIRSMKEFFLILIYLSCLNNVV